MNTDSAVLERPGEAAAPASPWLKPKEAAARARCGEKFIRDQIRRGKLKAVRLGAKQYRTHITWVDAWLEARSTGELVNADAPGPDQPLRFARR